MSAAARKYRWNLVKGYADEFYEHGYCGGVKRWIVTSRHSSCQHDKKGGPPDYVGHREIAKYERSVARRPVPYK